MMAAAHSIEDRVADVFDAAGEYVRARRAFLEAYNRADARKRLDAAWAELASYFSEGVGLAGRAKDNGANA